jgi:hypothetical protein
MTDIIKLARKVWGESAILPIADLERFAELVAKHEREECALVAQSLWHIDGQFTADKFTDAIRARAEEQT